MVKPTRISMVLFCWVSNMLCVQIEWGSNQDLVNEFNPIQGRENYKLMVALVGDKIKPVCDVAFASKPVEKIVWEIDGKIQTKESPQKEEEDKSTGKVFINDTLEIDITEKMDDKRVSCVYDEASVKAILHVFKLKFKIPAHVCETCDGEVELLFSESLRSKTGENNVDARIKSKIRVITKLTPNDKNSNSEYSVTLPISTAKNNQAVSNMNPDLQRCCPTPPDESTEIPWMNICIGVGACVASVGVAVVLVVKLVKKKKLLGHGRLDEMQM